MAELNLDGSMTVLRPGTNEWICIPGDQNIVGAADMCADPMGMVWIKDPMAGKPEPTNTSPGLIYMLNGATQRSFTDPFDQTSPAIPIGRTRCTSGRSTRRPPGSAPSCGARVVAGSSPVMRAGPISLPNTLGVTPGAREAAGRGGAQPAHLQRPPRPCRRHPHRKLVPARLGLLPAGCST